MIYALPGGAMARVLANTDGYPKYLQQTNSEAPIWVAVPGTGPTYFLTDTASDIASTLQMTSTTYSPKTTLGPYAVINGTQTIQEFATNAGTPHLTSIPAGTYEVHLHYTRSPAPIGTMTLQAVINEVSSTGVFIATIGTTEQTPVINPQGGEQEFSMDYVTTSPYTLSSINSRIAVLVQAICTSATPTISLFVGDTADAHLQIP